MAGLDTPALAGKEEIGAGLEQLHLQDRSGRPSFSSVREREDAVCGQTFTSTKISSYALDDSSQGALEDDDDDDNNNDAMSQTQLLPARVQSSANLNLGFFVPVDHLQSWSQAWVPSAGADSRDHGGHSAPLPGLSALESLPSELLLTIFHLLSKDVPTLGIEKRNQDLAACLLTSKTLHAVALDVLHTNITIPHSRIFKKFLAHLRHAPSLGLLVRRLDFSHFNPGQLFLTAQERAQAQNLTSTTLLECLELTPNLHEFLAQEYLDDDLSEPVLQKLFLGLGKMKALDFCCCSSDRFRDAFRATVAEPDWPAELSITRLSLHKCMTLPASVLEAIVPRLAKVTHLDVAGTRMTNRALTCIPATATLTHLNLSKCNLLTADVVVDFFATHPAVRERLTFLSLAMDATTHLLLDVDDVTALLPALPASLRSLSLKGSKMKPAHIDMLRPLTKHLEELAIGRGIRETDINRLLVPDEPSSPTPLEDTTDGSAAAAAALAAAIDGWTPHSLRFLDLSDLRTDSLDQLFLFSGRSAVLTRFSEPLEAIELSVSVLRDMRNAETSLVHRGWCTKEQDHRGWIVRQRQQQRDSGLPGRGGRYRWWKMGAESWGMRKIPVCKAEVGGIYGRHMFGDRL